MSQARAQRQVAIVVRRRAFGELLADALDATDDLACTVVGTHPDDVSLAGSAPVDVVVVDQPVGPADLPRLLARLEQRWPGAWPVVLTDEAHPPAPAPPFTSVDRACATVDLLDEIRTAGRDVVVVTAGTVRTARQRAAGSREHGVHLTPRERDVLRLLTEGHGAPAIATQLGMSVHTCRGHLKSLMQKFDAHSQVELVMRVGQPTAPPTHGDRPRS